MLTVHDVCVCRYKHGGRAEAVQAQTRIQKAALSCLQVGPAPRADHTPRQCSLLEYFQFFLLLYLKP